MNPDPISQLPEPYRLAWELLHEPFDYEWILREVLASTRKMVDAEWGMMILDEDVEGLEYKAPGFRTLPDILNTTIPVGHVSSFAYALARKVIQEDQSVLLADMHQLDESQRNQLIDNYLPVKAKEQITEYATKQWFASRSVEIPPSSNFTIMVVPLAVRGKNAGAIYLHRSLDRGVFTPMLLEKVETFLACVGIGIKNARSVMAVKALAMELPYQLSVELKTPLIAIRGFAEILYKDPVGIRGATDADVVRFSKIIMDNADRMRSMLDGLLLYGRIKQEQITSQGAKPNEVLDPIVEKYRTLIQDKRQSLVLEIADISGVEVNADHFLSEVMEALIKNAYLYTPEQGEIRISAMRKDGMFHFCVSDTGYGLTEEEVSQLFRMYYRSFRSEVRNIPGNGLSLFLAKQLIEFWGGQIEAEGIPNQGSTFRFRLPLKQD